MSDLSLKKRIQRVVKSYFSENRKERLMHIIHFSPICLCNFTIRQAVIGMRTSADKIVLSIITNQVYTHPNNTDNS